MKKELTELQSAAARLLGKHILVSAGAGTGKTTVLVERFIHYVVSGHATASEILALTFTEKAANEMKRRILQEFRIRGLESACRELESAYISTIHAFAARLLREHPLEAGIDPEFRVLESEESLMIKEQLFEQLLTDICETGSDVFHLLKVYGEGRVREGVFQLYHAACADAQELNDYFQSAQVDLEAELSKLKGVGDLFAQVGEQAWAKDWGRFFKLKEWDWATVEGYKVWMKQFSRKRGKKGDDTWQRIKDSCKSLLSIKIEPLGVAAQKTLEELTRQFHERYGGYKLERGCLDFDDLQMKALRLLNQDHPASQMLLARYREKFRFVMVDEFQDTNEVQLELVELLSGENNLFLVGDYKQSIYQFRGAEPGLFLNKEQAFLEGEDTAGLKLVENFRTDSEVLQFINPFFRSLWSEDGFEYDDLIEKVESSEGAGIEVLCVTPAEKETVDRQRMREANAIAERILQLREEGTPFGDIAILFQAMTDLGIYEQALKNKGIPYYAISSRGFYHQPEVRDLLSYLAFLENPLSDIPLAAVLRSPLFQITDNTLLTISQLGDENATFYERVQEFDSSEDISENQKQNIRRFLEISGQLLEIRDRVTVAELVDRILEETAYELSVLADNQGIRRYANLRKVVNMAREYAHLEPMSLSGFLRTMKRMQVQEAREAEAQIEAEESGHVVRLLSIHRAKGLEYPVVFVADMGRSRQASQSKAFLARTGYGYSMQVHNPLTGELEKPATWVKIDELMSRREREEWKRLCYVAFTRAKTKLILSGAFEQSKKEVDSFSDMKSWMQWIMNSEHVESLNIIEVEAYQQKGVEKPFASREIVREAFETLDFSFLNEKLNKSELQMGKQAAADVLHHIQSREPRLARNIDLPVSAYASFRHSPKEYIERYELGFPFEGGGEETRQVTREQEEGSAADFGTAMHACLEFLDFKKPSKTLKKIAQESFSKFSPEAGEEGIRLIEEFIKAPLFKALQNAKTIKREIPFLINERHGLIHGIIDVLFQDQQGDWHVLDYKTAVGDKKKVGESGYDWQIEFYGYAVYKLLGVVPKSGILYFMKNAWEYQTQFDEKRFELIQEQIQSVQEELLNLRAKLHQSREIEHVL